MAGESFNISDSVVTNDSVQFPPAISHDPLASIPNDVENATLEVVFKGEGAIIWQEWTKLSASYIDGQVTIRSDKYPEQPVNSTPEFRVSTEKVVMAIQSDKVILNGHVLPINARHSYYADQNKMWLGYMRQQSPHPLEGAICEIRYYNRKLSSQEIYYNMLVDNVRFNIGLNLAGGFIIERTRTIAQSRRIVDENYYE